MASRWRFPLLAAALVLLNTAGLLCIRHELLGRGRPAMRVLSVLPSGDADAADRLSLIFDEPLAPRDAVGAVAPSSPFRVQPQPKGHWTWSRPDRLDFVLDEPLPPGRVFWLRPVADLQTRTGRVLLGPKEYRFQTRPLSLDSCQPGSADREQVTIELLFNQPVTPADLVRNLQVLDAEDSHDLHPACLTVKPDAKMVVRCDRPSKDKVRVHLQPQLAGSGAELPLGEPVSFEVSLPRTFALLRGEVNEPDLDPNIIVDLAFSQDLDDRQPVPAVQLDPPVKDLQVRLSYGRLILEGPFECGRRYTAAVGADVKSEAGQVLGSRQSVTFEVPDREPAMAFPLRRGTLSPAGAMQVDLKAVNVSSLNLSAYRVYANNLVAHVRGERPSDTAREILTRTVPLGLKRNAVTTLALDLRDLLGGLAPGIYIVRAQAAERCWTADSVIVTVSDLVITAKKERQPP